ncbi:unnamed protein product [Owenia fusiformis]|uniref:Uncharacterized protein n=1 Tax=Owenia fusiformis TaxID=6347 RepID=A0A8J1YD76_OWEFU|nr:unnamed protein product [Owenia fusiformis]
MRTMGTVMTALIVLFACIITTDAQSNKIKEALKRLLKKSPVGTQILKTMIKRLEELNGRIDVENMLQQAEDHFYETACHLAINVKCKPKNPMCDELSDVHANCCFLIEPFNMTQASDAAAFCISDCVETNKKTALAAMKECNSSSVHGLFVDGQIKVEHICDDEKKMQTSKRKSKKFDQSEEEVDFKCVSKYNRKPSKNGCCSLKVGDPMEIVCTRKCQTQL